MAAKNGESQNYFFLEKPLKPMEIMKIVKNFPREVCREFQELQIPFFID